MVKSMAFPPLIFVHRLERVFGCERDGPSTVEARFGSRLLATALWREEQFDEIPVSAEVLCMQVPYDRLFFV
jgi:hypothetical protein